jgi:general nucleoside transport system permease protein
MRNFLAKPFVREFLRIVLAVSIALLLGFIIALFTSKEPVAAYQAFLTGPVSRLNRFGEWMKEAITLTLLGLAVAMVFKANLFSLGQEGQMALGALVSGAIALFVPLPGIIRIPLALIAAMVVGFIWGWIPGVLKAKLNANELVSTLMLNAIALRFYEYVLIFFIKPPNAPYNSSDDFPVAGALPHFIPPLPFLMDIYKYWSARANVTVMLYLAIITAVVIWYLMYRTPFGYELRMIGANLKFARYGGVNTQRVIALSMGISGIVAGLAGAHLAMGVNQKLIMNITVGLGFEGVVVALLARNNPVAVPFAALAYGYLREGATVMELSSDVSREMVLIIQAVIILLVTAERIMPIIQRSIAERRASVTAAAEGEPDA